MKITQPQQRYFYHNFRFEFDDYFEKMTRRQAEKFISKAETIRATYNDPVERARLLYSYATEFKKELDNPSCSSCHKPVAPVNSTETCSC